MPLAPRRRLPTVPGGKPYPIHPKPGSTTRPGLYKCSSSSCRRQFSVVTGTIFERTHLPLYVWLHAIDRLCATPAGLTPRELQRVLTVFYQTASVMADRLRLAMARWPVNLKIRPRPVRTKRDRTVVRLHPMGFAEAVTRLLRVEMGSAVRRLQQLGARDANSQSGPSPLGLSHSEKE